MAPYLAPDIAPDPTPYLVTHLSPLPCHVSNGRPAPAGDLTCLETPSTHIHARQPNPLPVRLSLSMSLSLSSSHPARQWPMREREAAYQAQQRARILDEIVEAAAGTPAWTSVLAHPSRRANFHPLSLFSTPCSLLNPLVPQGAVAAAVVGVMG